MSLTLDETAGDVPVRDMNVHQYHPISLPQGHAQVYQNVRARQDISRVSREELEDRLLRLYEESQLLKRHIHTQDDKIKKMGTRLMRKEKEQGRREQLAAGAGQPLSRAQDVEMEEMVVRGLQEKVRGLQSENEKLKRLVMSRRPTPYSHVHARINTGVKKLRDNTFSPSQTRPRSTRSFEGGGRPPTGPLPRYRHSLLEDARAEIRNLENVIESQRSQIEEMESASELLRQEMRKKEEEFEERLQRDRHQHSSKLRSHVSNNLTMIKLQKQLVDRSNTITEMEGRFLQLQENLRVLKVSHDAAIAKVDELSGQLKNERLKSLDLEKQLQSSAITKMKMEQLQEQISELEQEKELLKENNERLVNSAFDVSQQQKWQIQEQQLKLQIAKLETALKADLLDKNEILDKIKAERDANERVTEENKKLHIQLLEQKQQLDKLNDRLKAYSRDNEYDKAELTEALLLIKKRKSQKSGELSFLNEVEEGGGGDAESVIKELRAAHADTIQELEKTRNILSMESKINRDYKVQLDAVIQKMENDKMEHKQKQEHQAQQLDKRAAKIMNLEAQLKEIACGTKSYVLKSDISDKADEFDETLHLERGQNLLELQIVGAALSPSAVELLGDGEISTFCTYSLYLFELHSTAVATGPSPAYGFTSKYVVSMNEEFLDYLHKYSVSVELHQARGVDWTTLASGQLRLQQLLEQDGKIHGTIPLIGVSDNVRSFGSLDYWMRLRIPMTETIRLYNEKVKAVSYLSSTLSQDRQSGFLYPTPTASVSHTNQKAPASSGWNEVQITVQCCRGLQSRRSQQPSPFVVYKFYNFSDYPSSTVHDCCNPHFADLKSYSIPMDVDVDEYLKSEVLQFYVFDYNEEQMDVYLGKARVPLLPLAQNKEISGVFKLMDASGLPAGQLEVMLKWKFPYLLPPNSIVTVEEPKLLPKENPIVDTVEPKPEKGRQKQGKEDKDVKEIPRAEKEDKDLRHPSVLPDVAAHKVKQKTPVTEGPGAKKVKFVDDTSRDHWFGNKKPQDPIAPIKKKETLAAVAKIVPETVEDEDEPSCISDGQLLTVSSLLDSDDSDISEDIEDVEEATAVRRDQSELTQSDSDDCIVHGQATGRKPSDRVRLEIISLNLRPDSRVSRDSSVVRLFVEYSFLDLAPEETPLSLPKPPRGKSINYNYSKVFPVDANTSSTRRQLLRGVLQGKNPQMERIRFTVVSEPLEEEEQEMECEDVGVAFLRIPEVLEKQKDLVEASLKVVDVEDDSEVIGSLTVSFEGLEALRAIVEEPAAEQTPVSSVLSTA